MAEPTGVDSVSRRTILKGMVGVAGLVSIPAILAACSTTGSSAAASGGAGAGGSGAVGTLTIGSYHTDPGEPEGMAAVNAALAQFEDTIKKFPTLFPDSIKGLKAEGDYSASLKVWEDRAGFDEHIATFAKAVADAKGKITDLDSLKVVLPTIGKQCGGCHETYRVKNG